jgi:ubiquinone/menaquinone biosynthesis C-methylase UbiE
MLSRWLGRQLRQPSGLGGWLIARIMNRSNAAMNQRAIELLDVQPTHAVLEVGFGGGLALAPLLARARSGRVTGVDPSDDMLAAAAEHHRAAIASGRLRLERAGVEALPHGDREFDRVLSVNTLYFWPDPARGFAEIRRVLRPGGKLVLGYRPAERMRKLGFTRHDFRLFEDGEVLRLLGDAGFEMLAMEAGRQGLGHISVVARPTG